MPQMILFARRSTSFNLRAMFVPAEACSSRPLLLLASWEVTGVDPGPPGFASGVGLVHFLVWRQPKAPQC